MLPEPVRPSPVDLQKVIKLLAARCRREILLALGRRPRIVKELAADLGIETTSATQHLKALRQAGMVVFRQTGHGRMYRPGPCLYVSFANGGLHIAARASCGSLVSVALTPEQTARHDWESSGVTTRLNGNHVKVPRAAAPARTARAPKQSRPPSGPA